MSQKPLGRQVAAPLETGRASQKPSTFAPRKRSRIRDFRPLDLLSQMGWVYGHLPGSAELVGRSGSDVNVSRSTFTAAPAVCRPPRLLHIIVPHATDTRNA